MQYRLEYDETDPKSIEAYGEKLIWKTFAEVFEEYDITQAMVFRETKNY